MTEGNREVKKKTEEGPRIDTRGSSELGEKEEEGELGKHLEGRKTGENGIL